MSAADDPTIEILLRHRAFVRGLARHLLVDPDAADDVVQQTWIAAWRRSATGQPIQRSWLARIAINFAFNRRRDAQRRIAREASAPALADLPSAAEIVAAEDERRRLVDAVLALDEPLRTTMLLRYLRDRTELEVASQLGVPLETVRGRLKTARARLRERLGGDDDAPRSVRALIALSGWSAEEAAAAIAGGKGLILASAQAWMGLVASLVIAVWLSWRVVDDRSSAPSLPASATPIVGALAMENGGAPEAENSGASGAPRIARTVRAADAVTTSREWHGRVVRGRCVSRDGAVVVGARIESALASAPVESDHDGRFSLQLPFASRRLDTPSTQLDVVVIAAHYAKKRLSFLATSNTAIELGDIRLSPGGTIRGRVLDTADRPLGAQLDLVRGNPSAEAWWAFEPRASEAPLVEPIHAARDGTFVVEHLDEGWYALVPREETLTCDAPIAVAVIANGASDVTVRLRPAADDERVSVVVADADGIPLAGARVQWILAFDNPLGRGPTRRNVETDANGRCALIVPPRSTHAFTTTFADGRVARIDGVRGGDDDVLLRPPACAIAEVTVIDASTGAPCVGARVSFVTRDDRRGPPPRRTGLDVARDRGTAAVRAATRARRVGDRGANAETPHAPPPDARGWSATTDAQGIARVPVPDVPYFIDVSLAGYASAFDGPFDALVEPAPQRIALGAETRLHGIVFAEGVPVAGAEVQLARIGPERLDHGPRRRPSELVVLDPPTLTQQDGSFQWRWDDWTRRGDGWHLLAQSPLGAAAVVLDGSMLATATRADTPLRIDLEPCGELWGVVDATGPRGAAGLVVTAQSAAGATRATRVAYDGTYRLDALHAGLWGVCVSAEDIVATDLTWGPATQHARVTAGTATQLDLTWTATRVADVSGDVRIDGATPFGTRVHLVPITPSADIETIAIERAPTTSDVGPGGTVELQVATLGTHLFAVTVDDGVLQLVARRRIQLVPGRNQVRIVTDGGSVEGHCGHPDAGFVLLRGTLADETRVTLRVRCAADGHFVAHRVPAGVYRIRGASDAKSIQIHVGATTSVELK